MRTRLNSSSHSVSSPSGGHQSVLLHEVQHALDIQPDDVVLDGTLGGGGHARELAKGLGSRGLFIGFDLDQDAIERTRELFRGLAVHAIFIVANFRNISTELASRDTPKLTKALFDLGWSSYQLDSGRGFSFLKDEPLLMTYAKPARPETGRSGADGAALTAETIVNTWAESSLADVIYGFGGERYARRIAKGIVDERARRPIKTAKELAEVVRSAVPARARHGRIHPATKTFQALRIAVNDELGALKEGLTAAWSLLEDNGKIAVITFHSVEDRVVKHLFAEWVKQGDGKLFSKKPIAPTREETLANPRARSAKLRVIQKISNTILHGSSNTKNKQIRPFDISGET